MRLTKKSDNVYYTNAKFSSGAIFLDNNGSYTNACVNKLGQLEDIEEKLGIDLLTLLKNRSLAGLIDYVWHKTLHPKTKKEIIIKRDAVHLQNNGVLIVRAYDENYVTGLNIKDYGKTWALTKEELENESDTNKR